MAKQEKGWWLMLHKRPACAVSRIVLQGCGRCTAPSRTVMRTAGASRSASRASSSSSCARSMGAVQAGSAEPDGDILGPKASAAASSTRSAAACSVSTARYGRRCHSSLSAGQGSWTQAEISAGTAHRQQAGRNGHGFQHGTPHGAPPRPLPPQPAYLAEGGALHRLDQRPHTGAQQKHVPGQVGPAASGRLRRALQQKFGMRDSTLGQDVCAAARQILGAGWPKTPSRAGARRAAAAGTSAAQGSQGPEGAQKVTLAADSSEAAPLRT